MCLKLIIQLSHVDVILGNVGDEELSTGSIGMGIVQVTGN